MGYGVVGNRVAVVCMLVAGGFSFSSAGVEARQSGLPMVLPQDFETRAALAAAPPLVAEGAGVWLLGDEGYWEARPSTNGFNCLVQRDPIPGDDPARQMFTPQCFGEAASASVMQRHLARARMVRRDGMSDQEALAAMAANPEPFAVKGHGLVYMASNLNTQPDPSNRAGPFRNYPPHVMFLGPNVPDEAVNGGSISTQGPSAFYTGWPFLAGPTRPDGLIIMPLDRTVRDAIVREQAGLLRELSRYVPRQESPPIGS